MNPKGRYILFCGATYYPCKWDDFVGRFDTLEDALSSEAVKSQDEYEWYEIVDLETNVVVSD